MKRKKGTASGHGKKASSSTAHDLEEENNRLRRQLQESNDKLEKIHSQAQDLQKMGINIDQLNATLTSGCSGDVAQFVSAMQRFSLLSSTSSATVTTPKEDSSLVSDPNEKPEKTESSKTSPDVLNEISETSTTSPEVLDEKSETSKISPEGLDDSPLSLQLPVSRRSLLFKTNISKPSKGGDTVNDSIAHKTLDIASKPIKGGTTVDDSIAHKTLDITCKPNKGGETVNKTLDITCKDKPIKVDNTVTNTVIAIEPWKEMEILSKDEKTSNAVIDLTVTETLEDTPETADAEHMDNVTEKVVVGEDNVPDKSTENDVTQNITPDDAYNTNNTSDHNVEDNFIGVCKTSSDKLIHHTDKLYGVAECDNLSSSARVYDNHSPRMKKRKVKNKSMSPLSEKSLIDKSTIENAYRMHVKVMQGVVKESVQESIEEYGVPITEDFISTSRNIVGKSSSQSEESIVTDDLHLENQVENAKTNAMEHFLESCSSNKVNPDRIFYAPTHTHHATARAAQAAWERKNHSIFYAPTHTHHATVRAARESKNQAMKKAGRIFWSKVSGVDRNRVKLVEWVEKQLGNEEKGLNHGETRTKGSISSQRSPRQTSAPLNQSNYTEDSTIKHTQILGEKNVIRSETSSDILCDVPWRESTKGVRTFNETNTSTANYAEGSSAISKQNKRTVIVTTATNTLTVSEFIEKVGDKPGLSSCIAPPDVTTRTTPTENIQHTDDITNVDADLLPCTLTESAWKLMEEYMKGKMTEAYPKRVRRDKKRVVSKKTNDALMKTHIEKLRHRLGDNSKKASKSRRSRSKAFVKDLPSTENLESLATNTVSFLDVNELSNEIPHTDNAASVVDMAELVNTEGISDEDICQAIEYVVSDILKHKTPSDQPLTESNSSTPELLKITLDECNKPIPRNYVATDGLISKTPVKPTFIEYKDECNNPTPRNSLATDGLISKTPVKPKFIEYKPHRLLYLIKQPTSGNSLQTNDLTNTSNVSPVNSSKGTVQSSTLPSPTEHKINSVKQQDISSEKRTATKTTNTQQVNTIKPTYFSTDTAIPNTSAPVDSTTNTTQDKTTHSRPQNIIFVKQPHPCSDDTNPRIKVRIMTNNGSYQRDDIVKTPMETALAVFQPYTMNHSEADLFVTYPPNMPTTLSQAAMNVINKTTDSDANNCGTQVDGVVSDCNLDTHNTLPEAADKNSLLNIVLHQKNSRFKDRAVGTVKPNNYHVNKNDHSPSNSAAAIQDGVIDCTHTATVSFTDQNFGTVKPNHYHVNKNDHSPGNSTGAIQDGVTDCTHTATVSFTDQNFGTVKPTNYHVNKNDHSPGNSTCAIQDGVTDCTDTVSVSVTDHIVGTVKPNNYHVNKNDSSPNNSTTSILDGVTDCNDTASVPKLLPTSLDKAPDTSVNIQIDNCAESTRSELMPVMPQIDISEGLSQTNPKKKLLTNIGSDRVIIRCNILDTVRTTTPTDFEEQESTAITCMEDSSSTVSPSIKITADQKSAQDKKLYLQEHDYSDSVSTVKTFEGRSNSQSHDLQLLLSTTLDSENTEDIRCDESCDEVTQNKCQDELEARPDTKTIGAAESSPLSSTIIEPQSSLLGTSQVVNDKIPSDATHENVSVDKNQSKTKDVNPINDLHLRHKESSGKLTQSKVRDALKALSDTKACDAEESSTLSPFTNRSQGSFLVTTSEVVKDKIPSNVTPERIQENDVKLFIPVDIKMYDTETLEESHVTITWLENDTVTDHNDVTSLCDTTCKGMQNRSERYDVGTISLDSSIKRKNVSESSEGSNIVLTKCSDGTKHILPVKPMWNKGNTYGTSEGLASVQPRATQSSDHRISESTSTCISNKGPAEDKCAVATSVQASPNTSPENTSKDITCFENIYYDGTFMEPSSEDEIRVDAELGISATAEEIHREMPSHSETSRDHVNKTLPTNDNNVEILMSTDNLAEGTVGNQPIIAVRRSLDKPSTLSECDNEYDEACRNATIKRSRSAPNTPRSRKRRSSEVETFNQVLPRLVHQFEGPTEIRNAKDVGQEVDAYHSDDHGTMEKLALVGSSGPLLSHFCTNDDIQTSDKTVSSKVNKDDSSDHSSVEWLASVSCDDPPQNPCDTEVTYENVETSDVVSSETDRAHSVIYHHFHAQGEHLDIPENVLSGKFDKVDPLAEPTMKQAASDSTDDPIQHDQLLMSGDQIKHDLLLMTGDPIKHDQLLMTDDPIKHDQLLMTGDPIKHDQLLMTGDQIKHDQLLMTDDPIKHDQLLMTDDPIKHDQLLMTGDQIKHDQLLMTGDQIKRDQLHSNMDVELYRDYDSDENVHLVLELSDDEQDEFVNKEMGLSKESVLVDDDEVCIIVNVIDLTTDTINGTMDTQCSGNIDLEMAWESNVLSNVKSDVLNNNIDMQIRMTENSRSIDASVMENNQETEEIPSMNDTEIIYIDIPEVQMSTSSVESHNTTKTEQHKAIQELKKPTDEISIIKPVKDAWFQCSYCNYWTTVREKYKRHYINLHKPKDQNFIASPAKTSRAKDRRFQRKHKTPHVIVSQRDTGKRNTVADDNLVCTDKSKMESNQQAESRGASISANDNYIQNSYADIPMNTITTRSNDGQGIEENTQAKDQQEPNKLTANVSVMEAVKDSWFQCSYCNYWTTVHDKYKKHYYRFHKPKVLSYKTNNRTTFKTKEKLRKLKRKAKNSRIVSREILAERFIKEEIVSSAEDSSIKSPIPDDNLVSLDVPSNVQMHLTQTIPEHHSDNTKSQETNSKSPSINSVKRYPQESDASVVVGQCSMISPEQGEPTDYNSASTVSYSPIKATKESYFSHLNLCELTKIKSSKKTNESPKRRLRKTLLSRYSKPPQTYREKKSPEVARALFNVTQTNISTQESSLPPQSEAKPINSEEGTNMEPVSKNLEDIVDITEDIIDLTEDLEESITGDKSPDTQRSITENVEMLHGRRMDLRLWRIEDIAMCGYGSHYDSSDNDTESNADIVIGDVMTSENVLSNIIGDGHIMTADHGSETIETVIVNDSDKVSEITTPPVLEAFCTSTGELDMDNVEVIDNIFKTNSDERVDESISEDLYNSYKPTDMADVADKIDTSNAELKEMSSDKETISNPVVVPQKLPEKALNNSSETSKNFLDGPRFSEHEPNGNFASQTPSAILHTRNDRGFLVENDSEQIIPTTQNDNNIVSVDPPIICDDECAEVARDEEEPVMVALEHTKTADIMKITDDITSDVLASQELTTKSTGSQVDTEDQSAGKEICHIDATKSLDFISHINKVVSYVGSGMDDRSRPLSKTLSQPIEQNQSSDGINDTRTPGENSQGNFACRESTCFYKLNRKKSVDKRDAAVNTEPIENCQKIEDSQKTPLVVIAPSAYFPGMATMVVPIQKPPSPSNYVRVGRLGLHCSPLSKPQSTILNERNISKYNTRYANLLNSDKSVINMQREPDRTESSIANTPSTLSTKLLDQFPSTLVKIVNQCSTDKSKISMQKLPVKQDVGQPILPNYEDALITDKVKQDVGQPILPNYEDALITDKVKQDVGQPILPNYEDALITDNKVKQDVGQLILPNHEDALISHNNEKVQNCHNEEQSTQENQNIDPVISVKSINKSRSSNKSYPNETDPVEETENVPTNKESPRRQSCKYCAKTYSSESHMLRHMSRAHPQSRTQNKRMMLSPCKAAAVTEISNTNIAMTDPKTAITDPKTAIAVPKKAIADPQKTFFDPKTAISNPKTAICNTNIECDDMARTTENTSYVCNQDVTAITYPKIADNASVKQTCYDSSTASATESEHGMLDIESNKYCICKYCAKVFSRPYLLRRHTYLKHYDLLSLSSETDLKDYANGVGEVSSDTIRMPKKSERYPAVCQYCNVTLSCSYSLKRHISRMHKMTTPVGKRSREAPCTTITTFKSGRTIHIYRNIQEQKKSHTETHPPKVGGTVLEQPIAPKLTTPVSLRSKNSIPNEGRALPSSIPNAMTNSSEPELSSSSKATTPAPLRSKNSTANVCESRTISLGDTAISSKEDKRIYFSSVTKRKRNQESVRTSAKNTSHTFEDIIDLTEDLEESTNNLLKDITFDRQSNDIPIEKHRRTRSKSPNIKQCNILSNDSLNMSTAKKDSTNVTELDKTPVQFCLCCKLERKMSNKKHLGHVPNLLSRSPRQAGASMKPVQSLSPYVVLTDYMRPGSEPKIVQKFQTLHMKNSLQTMASSSSNCDNSSDVQTTSQDASESVALQSRIINTMTDVSDASEITSGSHQKDSNQYSGQSGVDDDNTQVKINSSEISSGSHQKGTNCDQNSGESCIYKNNETEYFRSANRSVLGKRRAHYKQTNRKRLKLGQNVGLNTDTNLVI